MVDRFHSLAQGLLKRDLSEISTEETQALVDQYPFFAPFHFLNLVKHQGQTEAYNGHFSRSILYYHEPLTFDQFIHPVADIPFVTRNLQTPAPAKEPQDFVVEDTTEVLTVDSRTEWEPPAPEVDMRFDTHNLQSPAQVEEASDVAVEETIDAVAIERGAEWQRPAPEVGTPSDMQISQPPAPVEEMPRFAVEETTDTLLVDPRAEWESPAPAVVPSEPVQTEPVPVPVAASTVDSPAFSFEPFHTVDYFASQGIKISNTPAPDDKFGKQVKSFTDWLKTRKKLPLAEMVKNQTEVVDLGVESLAEHSVQDSKVVTESMAEVWAKQGNLIRAREVYQKLSLQSPAKSAYFAAKIHELNVS